MMRIDIGTLEGILSAQRRLEKLIPVESGTYGLLQQVQSRVLELDKDDCAALMEALLVLKSNCHVLRCCQIDVTDKD